MIDKTYFDSNLSIPEEVNNLISTFLDDFQPLELSLGGKLLINNDKKSSSFYISCHLKVRDILENVDFEASLDGNDEDETYKLNRDITENENAFLLMLDDASNGRSFEDIVVEYDMSYNSERPLKIYGGQHRIKAIIQSAKGNEQIAHGFRIYFNLSKDQKVEIATINNTSIAVSNDLLDRMREQMVGTELRDFCQLVGFLPMKQDFSDRRDPIIPTVRLARTLIVNYYTGLNAIEDEFHQPVICKSGGMDENYFALRGLIDWSDARLIELGKQFFKLHSKQREVVLGRTNDSSAEYARKAISLAVISTWAYAAGYYQRDTDKLDVLYSIPDNVSSNNDPLNAKALSNARLRGVDPDTYRGLGTRSNAKELGRMLELFFVLVDRATVKKITPKIADAAIASYEAKKREIEKQKALDKI